MAFDVNQIRQEFPILTRKIGKHPLVYLDSAATAQKPKCVVDAMMDFYVTKNANINRGMHALAEEATAAYNHARTVVSKFLNAKSSHEILFTKGATEAINLVARTWGDSTLKKGDVIALSIMEHHSNIIPWMQLCERTGATIEWIPLNKERELDLPQLEHVLSKGNVKLVSMTGLSNVLGLAPPLAEIANLAHANGANILIDAAQLVAHKQIDVQNIDCDFLVFSGHKLYGPTGIGVLYAKAALLEHMPPFLGGGDMIQNVTLKGFTHAELPRKFEAGTPAIAEAIGLAAAVEWFQTLEDEELCKHESSLLQLSYKKLSCIPAVNILGSLNYKPQTKNSCHGCISFTVDRIHPHDLTQILSDQGICLRGGHHCCQPLHQALDIVASTRLSVGVYNTIEEIERSCEALNAAIALLSR